MAIDLLQRAVPPLKLLLGTREAAQALAVSQAYLREMVRRGEITPIRLPCAFGGTPRALRFPVAELERFIEKCKAGAELSLSPEQ